MTNGTNTFTFDADHAQNDVFTYMPSSVGLSYKQYNNLMAECIKHHGETVTPEKYTDMISNLIFSVLDGLL